MNLHRLQQFGAAEKLPDILDGEEQVSPSSLPVDGLLRAGNSVEDSVAALPQGAIKLVSSEGSRETHTVAQVAQLMFLR